MTATAAIEAVWRIESGRLIAGLARLTHDVPLAEDLAQDALLAALEQWPTTGVPENPGAWLMTTAKRRGIDLFRRNDRLDERHAQLARELADAAPGHGLADFEAVDESVDDDIGDDLLKLIFTCCHPVLAPPARVALTLRMLGGLSTEEIARAYLVPEATVAQRIVRAKKTLTQARVPFEVPPPSDRDARLGSVLEVVYLIFNEGYSATAGEDWMRPTLCAEALRLARILTRLAPNDPEVHGLAALLELQASRSSARTDADGTPILLLEQNRARWDYLLIGRGLASLERAHAVDVPVGRYVLQAEIAACHARARRAADTDWRRIAALYAVLGRLTPSPVIELNRGMAVSMADGPAAGLVIIDELIARDALPGYHLLPSVRGDLLSRLGRGEEAAAEFRRAAELTRNIRERDVLLARAAAAGQA